MVELKVLTMILTKLHRWVLLKHVRLKMKLTWELVVKKRNVTLINLAELVETVLKIISKNMDSGVDFGEMSKTLVIMLKVELNRYGMVKRLMN